MLFFGFVFLPGVYYLNVQCEEAVWNENNYTIHCCAQFALGSGIILFSVTYSVGTVAVLLW